MQVFSTAEINENAFLALFIFFSGDLEKIIFKQVFKTSFFS